MGTRGAVGRGTGTRFFLLVALVTFAMRTASAQTAELPIGRIAWMAGCWELRAPTRVVEEYWMKPRGGTMLGMARTIVRDSLIEHESTLIRLRGDKLVYEANPSGQKPAIFPATVVSGDSVVFEAPEHDFPQRIGYMRHGADSLVAWIEGRSQGRARRIAYLYARVACPGR